MPAATLEPRTTSARKRVSRYAESNAAALAAGIPLKGYAHPRDFSEFYAREPKLVENWLRFRRCPKGLIEDYTQDLLAFLMRPVTDKGGVTYEDHIAYYQTEKMGGFGTRPAFIKHVFNMLQTEYPKAINRFKRSNTSGPNVLSISGPWETHQLAACSVKSPVDAPTEGSVTLQPLLSADDVLKFQVEDTAVEPQLIIDAFFAYLEAHTEPNTLAYARACLVYDTTVDIARAMGWSRSQCRSLTTDMLFWAKRFRAGKR